MLWVTGYREFIDSSFLAPVHFRPIAAANHRSPLLKIPAYLLKLALFWSEAHCPIMDKQTHYGFPPLAAWCTFQTLYLRKDDFRSRYTTVAVPFNEIWIQSSWAHTAAAWLLEPAVVLASQRPKRSGDIENPGKVDGLPSVTTTVSGPPTLSMKAHTSVNGSQIIYGTMRSLQGFSTQSLKIRSVM